MHRELDRHTTTQAAYVTQVPLCHTGATLRTWQSAYAPNDRVA